jgi:hypothetical protein
MLTSSTFWASTLESAIKAGAAAALAVIGATQFLTASAVDWTQVAGVGVLAVIVSILTAIAVPNPDIRAARAEARLEAAKAAEAAEKKAATAAKRKESNK